MASATWRARTAPCSVRARTRVPPSAFTDRTGDASWITTPSSRQARRSPQARRAGSTRAVPVRSSRPATYVGESTWARTRGGVEQLDVVAVGAHQLGRLGQLDGLVGGRGDRQLAGLLPVAVDRRGGRWSRRSRAGCPRRARRAGPARRASARGRCRSRGSARRPRSRRCARSPRSRTRRPPGRRRVDRGRARRPAAPSRGRCSRRRRRPGRPRPGRAVRAAPRGGRGRSSQKTDRLGAGQRGPDAPAPVRELTPARAAAGCAAHRRRRW